MAEAAAALDGHTTDDGSGWSSTDDDAGDAAADEDDVVQDAAWAESAERFQAALQAICDKYTAASSTVTDDDGFTVDEIVSLWGAVDSKEAGAERHCVTEPEGALRRRPPRDKAEQQHALLMQRFTEHMGTHAAPDISVNELCAALGVNRAGSAVAHTLAAVKPRLMHAMQQLAQGIVQQTPLLRTGPRGLLVLSRDAVVSFFIPELASRELQLH